LATGVLITGVGKGTKSLQDFLLCTKVYETVILFGTSTDTYDRVGKVLGKAPYDHVTKDLVEKALEQFRGKFMQLPPLYSALKMDGKPLYEYAREGKEIPRKIERREVEVLNLELVEWMEGGTHSHKPPTDEAGHAEVNLANQVWKQENVLPAGTKKEGEDSQESEDSKTPEEEALEEFERKKRKLSEDQDDLVREKPPSKRKIVQSSQDATMSGGLPPPDVEVTGENDAVASQGGLTSDEVPKATIEKSPTPSIKGPPAVKLRMTVTSGFYVRSLCHDLGAAVGSAATMAELERIRQGEFELGKNVLEYADLEKGEKVWGPKVEVMLDEWYEQDSRRPRTEKIVERHVGGGERDELTSENRERANRGTGRRERDERSSGHRGEDRRGSGKSERHERKPEHGEKRKSSAETSDRPRHRQRMNRDQQRGRDERSPEPRRRRNSSSDISERHHSHPPRERRDEQSSGHNGNDRRSAERSDSHRSQSSHHTRERTSPARYAKEERKLSPQTGSKERDA
jgi:tRNA pseudouridine55 synthase